MTLSRETPWQPDRRRHRSGSVTRQEQHRPVGLELVPDDLETQFLDRQNVVRSGRAKVAFRNVEALQVEASGLRSPRDLAPPSCGDAPAALHPHL